ncbi:MAG: glycosyltransferase family 39 protein, partial [Fibrobacter sp.]|nr:glycosyltransferase family 39 protein [Fibrobacter sp.]
KWFDFLISLVALGFGLACIRELLWGNSRYLAALLWSLWPSFILASPRIGNDILFYAMHAIALWGCIRYIRTSLGKYLLVAVLSATIAYWTKSTAVVTFGLVGVTVLVHTVPRVLHRLSRMEWASFAVLLVAGIIVVVRVLGGDVVGNAGGNDSTVLVQNHPGNFLFFDIRTFLMEPFTDPWHDELGRQFFWNYLAKTSLFGEFKLWMEPAGRWLACIASFCFVLLAGFTFAGLWRKKWNKIDFVLVTQAVAFFAAMIALRLKYPFSCSNDFRYIVPVLLCLLPFTAEGICGSGTSVKRRALGWTAVAVFVISASTVVLNA